MADISNGSWSEPLWDLEEGNYMFNSCSALTAFSSDLPNLTNGEYMFHYCTNLESFNGDLPNLTDGESMFYDCHKLETFSSDLPSLTYGYSMFESCSSLTSFSADLSSLTGGFFMFRNCNNLTTFSSDLPSLTEAFCMFYDCALASFSSDLSSLTNGSSMFSDCDKLTSFSSDLPSLTNGEDMFYRCKLNTASVQNIADTINTPSSKGTIHIGIGNSTPNEQEEAAFNTIASKNWTVYVGVNGGYGTQWKPTSLIPIDGEEQQTPIPFWAKPVQSDEEHAQYIDEQGNFFKILGGNFIYGDDLSTYGMFISEEDAAANMRLTPYTKPQTKIENQ